MGQVLEMLPDCRREKYMGHQLFWESDSPVHVAVTKDGEVTPRAMGVVAVAGVVGKHSALRGAVHSRGPDLLHGC